MYCQKCGKELNEGSMYCRDCGTSVGRNNMNYAPPGNGSNYYVSLREKSAGIAIVLGFLCAGLGHLYAGKLTRGLCILFGNMALSIPAMAISIWWFTDYYNYDYYYPDFSGIFLLILILNIPSLVLLIWSLYDVNKIVKEYNTRLKETGNPPW